MKEKNKMAKHAAELQKQLDAALLENKKMCGFMKETGMHLIRGPRR
jgi:hypothetical protein